MPSSAVQLFKQSIDVRNGVFVAGVLAFYGLFGSVISAVISLASVYSVYCIFRKYVAVVRCGITDFISIIILIYVGAGFLVALFHYDQNQSLNFALMRLAYLGFLPLLSILMLSSGKNLISKLEFGAGCGALLTTLYVLVTFNFGFDRAIGGAGNPGPFAVIMAVVYTVCTFAIARNWFEKRTLIYLVSMTGAGFCILASGMRSIWPVLLFAPVLAYWFVGRSIINEKRKRLSLQYKVMIGMGVMALGLLSIQDGFLHTRILQLSTDLEQIRQAENFNNSLGHRLVMWEYASQMIPDSVWIGYGVNYSIDGMRDFAQTRYGINLGKSHFHNIVVTAMMRGGLLELVPTLLLLLAPFFVAIKAYRHATNKYGIGLLLALGTIYVCSSLLNISFGHDIMDHLFIFMLVVSSAIVLAQNNLYNDLNTGDRLLQKNSAKHP